MNVHVLYSCRCKRANDWISEAKYPVITRDTTDASTTPVVLGKIKRIKSMQPKPLEEEIAKSLGEHRTNGGEIILAFCNKSARATHRLLGDAQ